MPRIDMHAHLAPDLRPANLPGVAVDGDGAALLDGARVGPTDLYHPDRLENHLDRGGLDEAIVSVPPPFYRRSLSGAEAAAWVRAVNDGLLAVVADRPRLTPLAYLPFEHPEVALAEYDRIAGDDRFAGVVGAAGGDAAALDGPALRPLWQRLDADRRTLQLHPGHSPDPRLAPYYLANLLGNPVETAVAVAQLVFGGVLGGYPGIRFVLVHCGGCVPAMVGRWERGHTSARPGVPVLLSTPAEAVRALYVDSLAHDPAVVDLAVSVFGADRLVLGSDWPFPMGTDDPAAAVSHRGADHARQVATDNAARALGRTPTGR
ncbi:amidohydrolase family protein [Micromonospora sp. RTGN7]|uniref:amidohydrolase family protein n=1 Tax=Micromonospora sp. RTGN7 TaxID=3016526 RepID=UPI0029FEF71E|nr:amidohydrolase family protein [Micromonospora sp. RTGN7]